MTERLFSTALLVLLTVPAHATAQLAETPAGEREEYVVYSAMIPEIYAEDESRFMVIANPTSRWSHQIAIKDFQFSYPAPIVSQETLDDYLLRNKTNRWLTRKLNLKVDYVLTGFDEIKILIGVSNPLDDWKVFFKQYPAAHGFIHFSRVGFNERMDQALLYAGWRCPGLCGQWEFILLAREGDAWKVVNRANRVVS